MFNRNSWNAAIATFGLGMLLSAAMTVPASAAEVDPLPAIQKLTQSQDPEGTWKKLSVTERKAVQREFNEARVVQTPAKRADPQVATRGPDDGAPAPSETSGPQDPTVAPRGSAPTPFKGCWSLSAEAEFRGGVTKKKMFGVTQTTRVCVNENGDVYETTVVAAVPQSYGYPGMRVSEPTTATNQVGWEGRGVARVDGTSGIKLPKDLGGFETTRTLCNQLRLNHDGYRYAGFTHCAL